MVATDSQATTEISSESGKPGRGQLHVCLWSVLVVLSICQFHEQDIHSYYLFSVHVYTCQIHKNELNIFYSQ